MLLIDVRNIGMILFDKRVILPFQFLLGSRRSRLEDLIVVLLAGKCKQHSIQ